MRPERVQTTRPWGASADCTHAGTLFDAWVEYLVMTLFAALARKNTAAA